MKTFTITMKHDKYHLTKVFEEDVMEALFANRQMMGYVMNKMYYELKKAIPDDEPAN